MPFAYQNFLFQLIMRQNNLLIFPFFASIVAKMKMMTKSDSPSGHISALIFAFIASKKDQNV